MKKLVSLFTLILFSFILNAPVTFAEKQVTNQLDIQPELTYATIKKGATLAAEDFIPALEEWHQLNITEISFPTNKKANTMNTGKLTTELDFKTKNGETYTSSLSYLVKNDVPTLSIDSVHYNQKSKHLSLRVSEKSTSVYMKADNTIFVMKPDKNGYFEGRYNPNELPSVLQFIAIDDSGNYSNEGILLLDKTATKEATLMENLSYHTFDSTLEGYLKKEGDLVINKQVIDTDAYGFFNLSFKKEPETIQLELKNKQKTQTYQWSPIILDNQTLNTLKKESVIIKMTHENYQKKAFLLASGCFNFSSNHFVYP